MSAVVLRVLMLRIEQIEPGIARMIKQRALGTNRHKVAQKVARFLYDYASVTVTAGAGPVYSPITIKIPAVGYQGVYTALRIAVPAALRLSCSTLGTLSQTRVTLDGDGSTYLVRQGPRLQCVATIKFVAL